MELLIVVAIALGCFVAIFATNDGKWRKSDKNNQDVEQ